MLLSTATAPGSSHIRVGQPGKINNQDSVCVRSDGDKCVAVLADGCGSQPFSGIGADIGANLTAKIIMEQLRQNNAVDWNSLAKTVAERLIPIVQTYDDMPFRDAVLRRFMFTLIAVVVNNDIVTVASFGDGYVVVDDEILEIESPIENTPPYLGYLFRKDSPYHNADLSDFLKFRTVLEKPLSEISKSLVVSTDGLAAVPLDDIHHPGLLGKANALQFWLNSHTIEHAEGDAIIPGICNDDVTLVLIRSNEAQKRLVESRATIAKLKADLKELLRDISMSVQRWRIDPVTRSAKEEAVGEVKKRKDALFEHAKQHKLDCKELMRQVVDELETLESITPRFTDSYFGRHYSNYSGYSESNVESFPGIGTSITKWVGKHFGKKKRSKRR